MQIRVDEPCRDIMKPLVGVLCTIVGAAVFWLLLQFLSTRLLDSRIDRLHETGLPKICVVSGTEIYCRMKADDFRFPLPPNSHTTKSAVTSGGFDWVDGIVNVAFDTSNHMTAAGYYQWLSNKLPMGASVTVQALPSGLAIKFHYFGDK